VSLNAYQDAFGAVDEAERHVGLAAHAASMRAHVNALGNKAYQTQFGNSPDYVVMFVPGEHFLSAALEHDPTLWDFAFDKKVLLATPTNLIAIARSVASVWQQEALARNARDIALLGKELYDRLAKVGRICERSAPASTAPSPTSTASPARSTAASSPRDASSRS
jgi:DNA recombination protein RmuC